MTRDDIIRMAKMAGMHHLTWDSDYIDGTEYFAALVEQHLIASGYRKCAENQKTTQHCALVEEAVKDEKEACAKECDKIERRKWDTVMSGGAMQGIGARDCAIAIRARGTT